VHTGRAVIGAVAAVLVALVLAVNALAEAALAEGDRVALGVLQLRLSYNSGVAFGLGGDLPVWVVAARLAWSLCCWPGTPGASRP